MTTKTYRFQDRQKSCGRFRHRRPADGLQFREADMAYYPGVPGTHPHQLTADPDPE